MLSRPLLNQGQGGSQSPGVVTRVVLTQKALDAALTRCNMEVAKAFADFQQQHGFGITGDQSFIQWYPTHAPAYVNALQAAAAAAADNKSALNDMSGPLAAQYNLDSDKLTQAMTSLAATPGYVTTFMKNQQAVLNKFLQDIHGCH